MTYGFSSPDIAITEQLRLQKLLSRAQMQGTSIQLRLVQYITAYTLPFIPDTSTGELKRNPSTSN
jgi:hypothetical protein